MLANYDYYCPCCKGKLSKEHGVHFLVENDKKQKADLYLSPLPGVYHYMSDKEISIDKGERIKFYCYTCREDLQSEVYPQLILIHLKVTDDILFDVLFSPVCGEKQTYVIMEGKLEKYAESFLAFDYPRREAS